jgi:hypothetical protein
VLDNSGKSLYRGRGSIACAIVNPLKKWLFVQRKYFFWNNKAHRWIATAHAVPSPFPCIENSRDNLWMTPHHRSLVLSYSTSIKSIQHFSDKFQTKFSQIDQKCGQFENKLEYISKPWSRLTLKVVYLISNNIYFYHLLFLKCFIFRTQNLVVPVTPGTPEKTCPQCCAVVYLNLCNEISVTFKTEGVFIESNKD